MNDDDVDHEEQEGDVVEPGASSSLSELKARLLSGPKEEQEAVGEPAEEQVSTTEQLTSPESSAPSPDTAVDQTPVYLLDEPPEGVSNWAKWALMHGMSEEEIENTGINHNTVRICAQELDRDGYRKRPKKPPKGGTQLQPYYSGTKGIQVFAKGGPPEALIEAIHLPLDGDLARSFEQGLKTGASLLVLGVRVAQELSAVGIQQAKPIMDMAREMRTGEAMAAKNAAMEAAGEAAAKVAGIFGPTLQNLQRPAEGADPMKSMMVRIMEPMMQNMMKMFMPQLASGSQPAGWQVVEEK